MSKDLKYFKEFLENPAAYNNRDFYGRLREWADYIDEHKDEFNYLQDDEWKETRERIIADIDRREDAREEFDELNEEFEKVHKLDYQKKIFLYQRWLLFMKTNQFLYDFTDEQISDMTEHLERSIRAEERCLIAGENLRVAEAEAEKSLKELDEALDEHYKNTGKIPILTMLPTKKKYDGN